RALLEALQSPRVRPQFETDTPADGESGPSRSGASPQGAAAPNVCLGRNGEPSDEIIKDVRTGEQFVFDRFYDLLTVAAGLTGAPRINGAAPVLNIRVELDDLTAGHGVGWVDGIVDPVPMSSVEQILCHGDITTTVFGLHGEVLQHGKTKRLFTTAQKAAMAARDGGCVWPGCDRGPSWCESHHVDDWKHQTYAPGRTDIDNGALLCHFHHTHVHSSEWKLAMQNGVPVLIPPKSIDWEQTPRPCSQIRSRRRGPLPTTPLPPWVRQPRPYTT
ncbi:HNH endonuclease, partial [Subtercola vilae]